MALLTDSDLREFLGDHRGWTSDGTEISRTYELASFSEAMAFVTRAALSAEKADHHPDIDIRWSKVRIGLTTHSEGGITDKDTTLAATLDSLTDT